MRFSKLYISIFAPRFPANQVNSLDPNGGDGASPTCSADTYCECSSGSVTGNYATMIATSDVCGWTTIPLETWTGSSCVSSTPSPRSGKYVYTQTVPPITESDTTVYGCTSTTHMNIGAPELGTECVDSTPISTITPTQTPSQTPTQSPMQTSTPAPTQTNPGQKIPTGSAPPSCFSASNSGFYAAGDSPSIFKAAINIFCGTDDNPLSAHLGVVGTTLDFDNTNFLYSQSCADLAKEDPSANCKASGGHASSKTSEVYINLGIKLIPNSGCTWAVDAPTCSSYFSSALTCPDQVGGEGVNECISWFMTAAYQQLDDTDWSLWPSHTAS